MKLVETHIINNKEVREICSKSKLLYNQSLYYLRQSYFGNIEKFTEFELTSLYAKYNEETFRALPATTGQQIVRILFQNWRSYWLALRDWIKNRSKYNGKPKMPNYKNETFMVVFTSGQVSIKNGFIHFPKISKLKPLKTKVEKIRQVRIVPYSTTFKIEVIYEKEPIDLKLNKDNVLSLDLGIDNFATSINNVGLHPFIINGKTLKSFNHWYNKKRAKLQSYVLNGKSNRLGKLHTYKSCFIEDKIHKFSRFIVDYCVKNDIGTIVIGKTKNWKDNINLGAITNQKFTEIPFSRFIEKVVYKSSLLNIDVKLQEESYSSKCDSLAIESVEKHETYLGKRNKRGLFQSSLNKLINADVNGAINIGRKVLGDSFAKTIINSGNAFLPYRVNIL